MAPFALIRAFGAQRACIMCLAVVWLCSSADASLPRRSPSLQELRRCLPLLLRVLRALLRFLAAAELSARLQPLLPSSTAAAAGRQRREAQWRVKCTEMLATVWAELAGLKVRACLLRV